MPGWFRWLTESLKAVLVVGFVFALALWAAGFDWWTGDFRWSLVPWRLGEMAVFMGLIAIVVWVSNHRQQH